MKDGTETIRSMDTTEDLVLSCDLLSTIVPEARSNLEMSTQTFKKETIECKDEEAPCNDYKYSSKPLESAEYVNYYDNKDHVMEQLKNEFPEDECPQLSGSVISKIAPETKELLKVINIHEVKNENEGDEFLFKIKEETDAVNPHEQQQYGEQGILDNDEDTNALDVLVTPEEVQCYLYGSSIKNSVNLLMPKNEHIKVEKDTSVDNEMDDLHQCQYCKKCFVGQDKMFAHVSKIHNKKKHKCYLCAELFKNESDLESHVLLSHKLNNPPNHVTGNRWKCKYCNTDFKTRRTLNNHVKLCRIGKEEIIYKCDSCESSFKRKHTLTLHMKRIHDRKIENEKVEYKCECCGAVFKVKQSLTKHVKRDHYDYGRMFDCSCGEQFSSLLHLQDHQKRRHECKLENTNTNKFQCDTCQKFYKSKQYLLTHIKRTHYDSGKMFDCWCGKQLSSPILLSEHKRKEHDQSVENKNVHYECKCCEAVLKSKQSLTNHMQRVHYEYGRMFDCSCGKQFRSPIHLSEHKWLRHHRKLKNTNMDMFQCDSCQKLFKTKKYLLLHIRRIHYDYGKTFECWCGKQYRSPVQLVEHRKAAHFLVYGGFRFSF